MRRNVPRRNKRGEASTSWLFFCFLSFPTTQSSRKVIGNNTDSERTVTYVPCGKCAECSFQTLLNCGHSYYFPYRILDKYVKGTAHGFLLAVLSITFLLDSTCFPSVLRCLKVQQIYDFVRKPYGFSVYSSFYCNKKMGKLKRSYPSNPSK